MDSFPENIRTAPSVPIIFGSQYGGYPYGCTEGTEGQKNSYCIVFCAFQNGSVG